MANADPKRPADWDVDNNWAIIYGLDAVARALQHPDHASGPLGPKLREAGDKLLRGLRKYQSPRGGWGYYSDSIAGWRPDWATSFTTAVAVLAMQEAQAAGLEVDDKMYQAPKQKGLLVLFDSRARHRVRRVRSGCRKSLVGWVLGPRWR